MAASLLSVSRCFTRQIRHSVGVISTLNKRNNSYDTLLSGDTIRIGCASGFWGDTAVSVPQLVHQGKIDYLVSDYLSEITMSLLTEMKKRGAANNMQLGYAPDFVDVAVAPYIKAIKQKGIKVISNAGGVNPLACAKMLSAACKKAGVEDVKIAVVNGDDLMPQLAELQCGSITEMNSGAPFPESVVTSMNAYLGAGPIARALDLGADIVVTGRCVDSALVLAPLIHRFKWSMDDFNKLAMGSLAGHLVECGAQSTGGIFTDWHTVPNWSNIGFPIVECAADSKFVITKPPKTGGLVSMATVSEQMLYEVGDPAKYYLPDVVCDFTQVNLQPVKSQEGEAVFVTNATGAPPSPNYKVSATYRDGYRITAVAPVCGPRAKDKAQRTADEIIKRVRGIFKLLKMDDFTRIHTEMLGSEHNYGPNSKLPGGCRECVMWLAAHHKDKMPLQVLSREVAPAGTGMAPGLTGIVGGRPKVSPVLKLFSFLHNKEQLKIEVIMDDKVVETYIQPDIPTVDYSDTPDSTGSPTHTDLARGSHTYRLEDLAYTRSGDKGDNANIGVIARHPALLPYLQNALTTQAVEQYFLHLFDNPENKKVERYDVPGVNALNFMLYNVLGGGGIASLRSDPQGKSYGQMLLDIEIKDMPDIKDLMK